MWPIRWFRSLVPILVLGAPPAVGAAAPLQVTSLAPAHNASAPPNTSVAVEFDKPVVPATIGPNSFRVLGRRSGPKHGAYAFSNGNRRVTFTPSAGFSAGETVQINLAHSIQATDLTFLRNAGFAFQFRVSTLLSQAQFQQIDVLSNRTAGAQTRIYGAAANDLDEDGYLDLATVNEVSADVRVFLNRGDGSGLFHPFLAPQAIGSESSPNESADFNNDGHMDLAISASSSNSVWILLGAGDGTFYSTQEIPVGTEPHGITTLDLDGDGDLDVVNANRASDLLTVMMNDGAGVFSPASNLEGGVAGEYGLVAADMNNDGIGDLVVGGNDGQEIRVQLGNGDGTFTAGGPARASGGWTWVVVVDDVNGDGNLDATVANSTSGNGAVLLGDGAGGFGPAAITTIGFHTVSTDLGDLDGDGDADWVLSSYGGGFWRIYLNDGAGNFAFAEEITAPSNPSCSILADLDNDGDLDLALTDEIADVVVLMRNLNLVDVPEHAPSRIELRANAPNPVVDGTTFRFGLPRATDVRIDVFDLAGRRVAGVPVGSRNAGWQNAAFDGRGFSGEQLRAGVYLFRITADGVERMGRMVVAR